MQEDSKEMFPIKLQENSNEIVKEAIGTFHKSPVLGDWVTKS